MMTIDGTPILFELTEPLPKSDKCARIDALFAEVFWPAVWRKVGKDEAQRAFRKALKNVCAEEHVLAPEAARRLAERAADEKKKALVPGQEFRAQLHPSTWLNNRRWNDEVPEGPGGSTPATYPLPCKRCATSDWIVVAEGCRRCDCPRGQKLLASDKANYAEVRKRYAWMFENGGTQ